MRNCWPVSVVKPRLTSCTTLRWTEQVKPAAGRAIPRNQRRAVGSRCQLYERQRACVVRVQSL